MHKTKKTTVKNTLSYDKNHSVSNNIRNEMLSSEVINNEAINNEAMKNKAITNKMLVNEVLVNEMLSHRPPKNSLSELIFLNKKDELEELLKTEIDPNRRDESGTTYSWTPLYWGVKLGRIECVKTLLHHGADINVVVNDYEECCGTVLDLATLRSDVDMEIVLREFAEKEDVNLGQAFKAIRTKLRGKAPAFNFKYYGKKEAA